jgi:tetraacyldisaccharide 4'-kinase
MSERLADALAVLGERVWELRRAAYARGWRAPVACGCRVVSVGNLSVGGTGKTTLTRHLMERALARGKRAAVVCRRYRPGPQGFGDEERLLRDSLPGGKVYAGRSKRVSAQAAAAEGAELVIVDDGFSHWALARDVEIVLVDAGRPLDSARMLPAGPLREPWRALQRADFVVASRLAPGEDPAPTLERLARRAPAAKLAAGRHEVSGARTLAGLSVPSAGRVRVVTGTGNPEAVAQSAREAGFEVSALAAYRDHHWFRTDEAGRERARAAAEGARVLLSPKDAVRWPARDDGETLVLEVAWRWIVGGDAVERSVLAEEGG